tara:strand:+ start:5763 stop:6092 length:330 start_codon:yes stop_codon:yes gene_type:complete
MKQSERIVKHIDRHGSINSIEAIRLYGITRLAAVIHTLRNTHQRMKAVKRSNTAPRFVTYVPDWDGRREAVRAQFIKELQSAPAYGLATTGIRFTTKLSLINIREGTTA